MIEDGLVWTVKLRQDAKFSDGKPVTTADVEYTFDTAAKSGSVIDLNIMERVEAVDEYTVKFILRDTPLILTRHRSASRHGLGCDRATIKPF